MKVQGLDPAFWAGRRTLITGHTGFKGGWLTLWLAQLGAEIRGFALAPEHSDGVFGRASEGLIESTFADISDYERLATVMHDFSPEVIIHLAAQPLVLESLRDPKRTYLTNVRGVENLCEAVRGSNSVRVLLNVTTDKVYRNETSSSTLFIESDPLGGKDPYSASKACSELITSAYYMSYLKRQNIGVVTARAGNVVGGGDWAQDRLVPDFFRALHCGKPITVRNPSFTRPWQHVFEPLLGYLILCQSTFNDPLHFSGAWNFGPNYQRAFSVLDMVHQLNNEVGGVVKIEQIDSLESSIEAQFLGLDSSKAERELGWRSILEFNEVVSLTASWYRQLASGADIRECSIEQLKWFMGKAVTA